MRLVKVKSKSYFDKEGKERIGYNYYLKLDNGGLVAVRPCFSNGYAIFSILAEEIKENA